MSHKAGSGEHSGHPQAHKASAPIPPTIAALTQEQIPLAEQAPISFGKLSAARAALQQFLSMELGAREIRITKLAPGDHGTPGWRAEAEILIPNLGMKMLGLPLTQEVLQRERYLIELEADLSIRSYEHLGSDED